MSESVPCAACGYLYDGKTLDSQGRVVCMDEPACRERAAEKRGYDKGLAKAEEIVRAEAARRLREHWVQRSLELVADAIRAAREGYDKELAKIRRFAVLFGAHQDFRVAIKEHWPGTPEELDALEDHLREIRDVVRAAREGGES